MNKTDKNTKISEQTYIITNPNTAFSVKEAYNSLRTNILYALSPINGKIVAITSANASEGKSTVAVNLSITLAQTSAKVLLIDADMRRPSIHKKLKLRNSTGLSRFVVGFESLSESLKRDVVPGLDVMTAGPIPPNPSELLSSQNMKVFLEKVCEYYDYIIVDCAPINVVTDVAVMSDSISGVLVVAKYGRTTYDDLKEVKSSLEKVSARILGFVVTEKSRSKNKKYKADSYYTADDR